MESQRKLHHRIVRRAARAARRRLAATAPYQTTPGGAQRFDAQYAAGAWDHLASEAEAPRFGIVAAYLQHFADGGRILEVGCGIGLLPSRLDRARYSEYLGIDISAEAISRAGAAADEKTRFRVVDATRFSPVGTYDAIVFNEVLEYVVNPAGTVRRFALSLAPGGVLILSQFIYADHRKGEKVLKLVSRDQDVLAEAVVSTRPGLTWTIRVLRPSGPGA